MNSRVVSLMMSEGVAIDQITSRLTVFNELDVIFTQAFPARLGRLAVVVVYESTETDEVFDERVVIRAANNELVRESNTRVTVRSQPHKPSHRSVHMFWDTALANAGEYLVSVERRKDADGAWEGAATRRLVVSSDAHPLIPPR